MRTTSMRALSSWLAFHFCATMPVRIADKLKIRALTRVGSVA